MMDFQLDVIKTNDSGRIELMISFVGRTAFLTTLLHLG